MPIPGLESSSVMSSDPFGDETDKQMCEMSRRTTPFADQYQYPLQISKLTSALYVFYDLHQWSLDDVAQMATWGNLRAQRLTISENTLTSPDTGWESIVRKYTTGPS
jgi:hypothetical protein